MTGIPKELDLGYFQDYLSSHEILDSQFTTGLFQDGITIYKQQIRSLNLFYAMFQLKRLQPGKRVCIIGGGVAGLTFAAAALKAKVDVLLLEKESIFLHLQQGCDIRKVHPNLYNWPYKGSSFPFPKLPLLFWKADTAANVAKQILQGFNDITKEETKDETKKKTKKKKIGFNHITKKKSIGDFQGYVNVEDDDENRPNIVKIEGDVFNVHFTGTRLKNGEFQEKDVVETSQMREVDYIIYCTGFGIEVSSQQDERVTPSYWRNDQYSQTIVDGNNLFHISGIGDGALVDLFRLKILNFSYDFFLSYFKSLTNEAEITKALIEIKNNIANQPKLTASDHYNLLLAKKELLMPLAVYLNDNRRNKIEVTLATGNKTKEEIIDFRKISFINGLIFFLLNISNRDANAKEGRWFDFSSGRTEKDKENDYCITRLDKNKNPLSRKIPKKTILILRHGTDRFKAFDGTSIPEDVLKEFEKKQKESKVFNNDSPLWTYESITALFGTKDERGFYTQETLSLCSSYVSILSSLIRASYSHKNLHYKLSLFRVIPGANGLNFQSITPYFGSDDSDGNSVGKLVPFNKGPLAMSAALQEPVLLKKNQRELSKILKLLNLQQNEIFSDSNSVLVIPILGKQENGSVSTNLLLCLDSKLLDIFENDNVLRVILATTRGWIKFIDKFVALKKILMDDVLFDPEIKITKEQAQKYKEVKENVSFVNENLILNKLSKRRYALVFSHFNSFDVYHNTNSEINQYKL